MSRFKSYFDRRHLSRNLRMIKSLLINAAVVVSVLLFLMYGLWKATLDGGRYHCRTLVTFISAGLIEYNSLNGSLPAAVSRGGDANHPYSWRVAILPYCGGSALGGLKYDFSDSWDGPGNAELRKQAPVAYHCGIDTSSISQTSYLVPTGPNTPFAEDSPVDLSTLRKGTSNTILIVESHNSGIHWMDPRDLSLADVSKGINHDDSVIRSTHRGFFTNKPTGAMTLFADGRSVYLNSKIDPKLLRSLVEMNNPEKPQKRFEPWE